MRKQWCEIEGQAKGLKRLRRFAVMALWYAKDIFAFTLVGPDDARVRKSLMRLLIAQTCGVGCPNNHLCT